MPHGRIIGSVLQTSEEAFLIGSVDATVTTLKSLCLAPAEDKRCNLSAVAATSTSQSLRDGAFLDYLTDLTCCIHTPHAQPDQQSLEFLTQGISNLVI